MAATREATRFADCGGVLSLEQEDAEGLVQRFVCYLGHAYAPYALHEAQTEGLEGALWNAVRRLEEHARSTRDPAGRMASSMARFARSLERKAEQSEPDAAVIREMLERVARSGGPANS